eukprot:763108-Hanusia_phi.AAC.1
MRNYERIRSLLTSSSSSSSLLLRNDSSSSNGECGCAGPAKKRQKTGDEAERKEDMNADLVPHVINLPITSAHAITLIFAAMVDYLSRKQDRKVAVEEEEEEEEKFSPSLLTEIHSVVSKIEGFSAHT